MTQPASRRGFLRTTGLVVAAGLAGCATGSGNTVEETTTTTSNPETTTTATEAQSTTSETTTTAESTGPTVEMRTDNKGSYFTPKGLLVEPGTTVTFVNESGAHAAAAYHPDNDAPLRIPEDAPSWSSAIFSEEGAEFEVTFDVPGVHDYFCPPHEMLGMVGRIVVAEPRGGPGTDPMEDVPPAGREKMPSIDDIVENGAVDGP